MNISSDIQNTKGNNSNTENYTLS
ncbi:MAG: hypothetical protein RLZZ210_1397, partial [Pseudomonadota bacterium]